MTSHVEQQIAARIAKVRAEGERRRQERAELTAARTAGLGQRHAQKLRNLATPADGVANQPTEETPPMANGPFRSLPCPSCRAVRNVRRVGAATIARAPYDIVKCPDAGCELMWLVRAEHSTPPHRGGADRVRKVPTGPNASARDHLPDAPAA